MKKEYITPFLEVIVYKNDDILLASGGTDNLPPATGGDWLPGYFD